MVKRVIPVLHLVDSFYRGGAQKVALDVIEALDTDLEVIYKHYVVYYQNYFDLIETMQNKNFKIFKAPYDGIKDCFKYVNFIRRFIKQYSIEIIHSHFIPLSLYARRAKKEVTIVTTLHGELFSNNSFKVTIINKLYKAAINRNDYYIAVSNFVKGHCIKHLSSQIVTIHNFVGDNYLNTEKKNYKKPYKFICTSNNWEYKNYQVLVKSLVLLRAFDKDFSISIYGKNMDSLKEQCEKLQITNIIFNSSTDNLIEVYKKFDFFLITSKYGEGFSLALLEAMKSGLIPITSDIPQFLEATNNESISFKNDDEFDLKKVIVSILENRYDLYQLNSKVRASVNQYSKLNFQASVKSLYDKLLKII